MNTIILIAALAQVPVELHAHPGIEGRYVRACLVTDYYVIDERSAVIRYYQSELRQIVKHRDTAGENFLAIGRTRTRIPAMAMDSQGMFILWAKTQCDQFNADHRAYETRPDYTFGHTAAYGMLDLGSGAKRLKPLKPPWKKLQLTGFVPPKIQE